MAVADIRSVLSDPLRKSRDELSPLSRALMIAEGRAAMLRNLQLVSILGLIMIPSFAFLDAIEYPQHAESFLWIRLWSCLLIVMGIVTARSPIGRRFYRGVTVGLPLVPAAAVALMIYLSGNPGSTYYAGMCLCIVSMSFVSHWFVREALIVSALVIIFFVAACLPALLRGVDQGQAAGFVSHFTFLVATAIVVIAGRRVHLSTRVKEYKIRDRFRRQKQRLRSQHQKLYATLRELHETEAELIQSERLASLGQIGASVIHEIGNPLNFSNQALYLLRKRLQMREEDPEITETLEDLQGSLNRMREIVKDLREFSRKPIDLEIGFNPAESVAVALKMLQSDIDRAELKIELDIEPDLHVRGNKNQFTQVLINLIQNSLHATGDVVEKRTPRIKLKARVVDGNAIISITDNGSGVDQETIPHLFEPFFTTKAAGVGTGLGLSICYRIIHAHKGTIRAESRFGEMTRFTISLPACREAFVTHAAPPDHAVLLADKPTQIYENAAI